TRFKCDWSSDVCSSDLTASNAMVPPAGFGAVAPVEMSIGLPVFSVPSFRFIARSMNFAAVPVPVLVTTYSVDVAGSMTGVLLMPYGPAEFRHVGDGTKLAASSDLCHRVPHGGSVWKA